MAAIEWEIRNWCSWHWSGMRWRRQRCSSIESRWRSPQPWDCAPVVPFGKTDSVRAQEVEDVWRGLPGKTKLLLKWHYVFCLSKGSILRKLRQRGLGFPGQQFQVELDAAKYRLAMALDRRDCFVLQLRNTVFLVPCALRRGAVCA
jgi:hypothetical protein